MIDTQTEPVMNTRFAVATHILTFLQTQNGVPASSDLIAGSVNTNPSLIRRLLQQLGKAGLTSSQMGTGGGALLGRAAGTITLLDVYRAVDEDGDVFAIHQDPNPRCLVGRNIQVVLKAQIDAAEQVMQAQLARTTIADMADNAAANDGQTAAKAALA
jgi:Rrf2 family protein